MNSLHYCISLIIIFSIGAGQLKNLQVLDFESERELKKYMKTIGKDLGVKCTFCHDINDKSIEDYLLQDRIEAIKKFDINATPTLIINGKKFDKSLNYKNIKKALEKLI